MSTQFLNDSIAERGAVCASSSDCVKVLDNRGMIQFFNEDGLRIMEIGSLDQVMGHYWPSL